MKRIILNRTTKQIYSFLLLSLSLLSCNNSKNEETIPKHDFLVNKWKISAIENNASMQLDSASQAIYVREMDYFIKDAYINFTDSLFTMNLAQEEKKGHYHFFNGDSILLLIDNKKDSMLFGLSRKKTAIELRPIASKREEKWTLVKF